MNPFGDNPVKKTSVNPFGDSAASQPVNSVGLPEFGSSDGLSSLFGDGEGFLDGQLGGDTASAGQLFKDAVAQFTTFDGAARVDGIEKRFPQLKVDRIDGGKNAVITNPQTGGRAIVNAKGVSINDIAPIIGTAAPAGKIFNAAKAIPKIGATGQAVIAGGVTDALIQGAEKAQGSDQGFSAGRVAFSGLAGGLGDKLIRVISSRIKRPVSADEAEKALQQAAQRNGLDASSLSDVQKARLVELELNAPSKSAADTASAADEFGVNLTRGQITEDAAQIAAEERLRNSGSANKLADLAKAQQDQVQDAVNNTGRQISGVDVTNNADLASNVALGVRDAKEAAKTGVNQAFKEAEEKSLIFSNDAFSEISKDFSEELGESLSARVESGLLPETQKTIEILNARLNNADFETSIKFLNAEIETLNKASRSASGVDGIGLSKVRNVIERKIDEAIDAGLYSGDQGAVDAIRKARSLAKDYYSKFTGGTGSADDRAGKIIEKLSDDDVSPEQAINFIFGSSASAGKRESLATVRRLKKIFPEGSNELNSLKAGAFNWVMRSANTPTDKNITKGQLMRRVEGAFSGQNRSVVNEIFTKDEISKMKRLARVVVKQQPDRLNGSNSGNVIIEGAKSIGSGRDGLIGGLIFLEPATAATLTGSLFGLKKLGERRVVNSALNTTFRKPQGSAIQSATPIAGESVGSEINSSFQ